MAFSFSTNDLSEFFIRELVNELNRLGNNSQGNEEVINDVLNNKIPAVMEIGKQITAINEGFRQGKNLFNPTLITTGKYVSQTNGTLITLAGFNATDFIPVQAGSKYFASVSASDLNSPIAYYDENKSFLIGVGAPSGSNNKNVILTAPAGAAFVRLSVKDAQLDNFMIIKSTFYEVFEPFIKKITKQGLDFIPAELTKTKNLFNKAAITAGKYVGYDSGALGTSAGYNASEFIVVKPNTLYTLLKSTGNFEQVAFYDINQKYISGLSTLTQTFTIPANAYFVRLSVKDAQLDNYMLAEGTATEYEPYGAFVPQSTLPKLPYAAVNKSKNLFDKNSITIGKYVGYNSGALGSAATYNASNFIPVKPNTLYTILKSAGNFEQLAYYDSAKAYVSGIATPTQTITTPANVYFIRLTVRDVQLDNFMFAEGTITEYEPYGLFVPKTVIPPLAYTTKEEVFKSATRTLHVGKSGYTYSTVKSALDTIVDTSQWTDVFIHEGVYEEKNLTLPKKVRLRGVGNAWIKGENPDNAADTDITPNSTLNVVYEFELYDLKITAKNLRYAIHSEGNGVYKDIDHYLFNCHVEHYGNESAKAWRTNNPDSGMSPNTVWNYPHAYGYGSASGLKLLADNCLFKSDTEAGWHVHNREKFTKPNVNILRNCTLSGKYSMMIESLGSGTRDKVILEGTCQLNGVIYCKDAPWIPTEIEYQYANHVEVDIGGACNPVPIDLTGIRGKALRINAVNMDYSSFSISGTAADAILGTITKKDGSGGNQAFVYGSLDISGIQVSLTSNVTVNNTLGRRLGNCSTTNKTLVVSLTSNSSKTFTITFNKDYTNLSNAAILNEINTVLGTSAIASEYNPAIDYVPSITNWYRCYKNSSTVGIRKGMAVVLDNAFDQIKRMQNSNGISDFIGIAVEDINPNEYGKIQVTGYFRREGISFGNKFTVNDGQLVTGTTNVVAVGMLNNYIGFNLK
ncbi:hypothetical protein M3611_23555 [Priestia megaterium]|uniref:hypothetical protein n=1 Tax=Priestia megaterium TaxID=1404 RepID=UPI00203AC99D|nr:hypothetical protein [Priestia megaterium]MCM3154993.1 hypothetical protein [Priestia megaterium]